LDKLVVLDHFLGRERLTDGGEAEAILEEPVRDAVIIPRAEEQVQ
jgi:hypothetical protein